MAPWWSLLERGSGTRRWRRTGRRGAGSRCPADLARPVGEAAGVGGAAEQAGVGHGHVDLGRRSGGGRERRRWRPSPRAGSCVRPRAWRPEPTPSGAAPVASRWAAVDEGGVGQRAVPGGERRLGARRRRRRRPAPRRRRTRSAQPIRSSKAGGAPKQASASRAAGPTATPNSFERRKACDHPAGSTCEPEVSMAAPVVDAACVGRPAEEVEVLLAHERGWVGEGLPAGWAWSAAGSTARRAWPGTGRGPRTVPPEHGGAAAGQPAVDDRGVVRSGSRPGP